MKKQTIVIASLFILLLLFVGGSYFYKNADHSVTGEKTTALMRPHAFVLGNPNAKTTIVEFCYHNQNYTLQFQSLLTLAAIEPLLFQGSKA